MIPVPQIAHSRRSWYLERFGIYTRRDITAWHAASPASLTHGPFEARAPQVDDAIGCAVRSSGAAMKLANHPLAIHAHDAPRRGPW